MRPRSMVAGSRTLAAGGGCAPECRFMAHLLITDNAVTIDMSRGERFEAAHGDQAFPRSAISGVRAVRTALPKSTA